MSAQDSNKVSVAEGWARYQRKVRPASRWKDAAVPEYDPNWLVTFHVCGKSWTKTAVGCPVAMGPKPVTAWCKEEIRTQAWMIQSGNIQEAQARRAPPRTIYGAEVIAEYLRNVPAKRDYAKNAQRFRSILEEATGKDVAEVPVNEETLTRQLLFKWVRMRQEYFRRGWSAHGAAPADAWEILREDLRAGNLPGIDKSGMYGGKHDDSDVSALCAVPVCESSRIPGRAEAAGAAGVYDVQRGDRGTEAGTGRFRRRWRCGSGAMRRRCGRRMLGSGCC
jgi:hypothetical protein